MADGQVIIEDNGGGVDGTGALALGKISIRREELNEAQAPVKKDMDELTDNSKLTHRIPFVRLVEVTATLGAVTLIRANNPDDVLILGVREQLGVTAPFPIVAVSASEPLVKVDSVYNTANPSRILKIVVNGV